ncbi:hypothetical protein AVV36_gp019 [Pectobacterium bacteriophage PM2]|uniref:Molybdenum ABC transporter n=1 Tax=Pectobacterium bacteriophage PM2 TaxID=1429794 RepID=A0A0A0Q096_9CAUD|nr:hypothetical protein AVV36_gp019 [Pectobacterium bacteriophage PM2]AHY24981.1 hypothetical protein PM2_019 [Pectobacterium bacteriophage PM2]
MDLFEFFDTSEEKEEPVDLIKELDMIIKSNGGNVPTSVLSALALYYQDPPPWAPWIK